MVTIIYRANDDSKGMMQIDTDVNHIRCCIEQNLLITWGNWGEVEDPKRDYVVEPWRGYISPSRIEDYYDIFDSIVVNAVRYFRNLKKASELERYGVKQTLKAVMMATNRHTFQYNGEKVYVSSDGTWDVSSTW